MPAGGRMDQGRYAAAWRRVQWAMVMLALLCAAGIGVAKDRPAPAPARTVLVMGDSLSAGYGMAASQGWVALMAARMRASHPGWRVVNASVSGETSAGGASRIGGELARVRPAVVVIALGANDGLRGLPLAQSRANLTRRVRAAKASTPSPTTRHSTPSFAITVIAWCICSTVAAIV